MKVSRFDDIRRVRKAKSNKLKKYLHGLPLTSEQRQEIVRLARCLG
ncbi:hypothetical protein [Vibrio phage vB_VhaP_PG11]|nr:hypothetical protein [Vibrio phage vB_VhaP_PG11]